MKITSTVLSVGIALAVLTVQRAQAVSGYVNLIPNGSKFSCANCHVNGVPPALNGFGSAFSSHGHAWSPTMANLDSDGDGFSNGTELQDPQGTWTSGSPAPGNAASVFNPGDASSKPTVTTTAPSITTAPASKAVAVGSNVTFTVVASGTAPLTYQWQFNSVNISGATSATLTLNSVTTANAGNYRVIVSNSAGTATSAQALLTVNVLATAPTITTQPASQTVTAGSNATFTVAATGSTPFTYQWLFNGTNLAGANSSILTLSGVTPAKAGTYSAIVSNSAGFAKSANATLTVNPPPTTAKPMVSVQAGQATTVEGATTPGTFVISRTGGTTAGLTVNFALSGTASNGVDYVTVSNTANIAAGASNTLVNIKALADVDIRAETNESVLLTLSPSAQGAYDIGMPNSAMITITEPISTPPTNNPPSTNNVGTAQVRLYTPRDGATFVAPARIIMTATASTTNGTISRVEFFSGTTRLGQGTVTRYGGGGENENENERSSNTPPMPTPPGTTGTSDNSPRNVYIYVWTNVRAGTYTITAKAMDSNGNTISSQPVHVTVRSGRSYPNDRNDQ